MRLSVVVQSHDNSPRKLSTLLSAKLFQTCKILCKILQHDRLLLTLLREDQSEVGDLTSDCLALGLDLRHDV